MISASKYHAYGNDFLIVASEQVSEENRSDFARAICDPHFGVGADGCIFVDRRPKGRFFLHIINRDGSEAGMSGNGCRCAASFLHHRRWAKQESLSLETISGHKICRLLTQKNLVWRYTTSLGEPSFAANAIPYIGGNVSTVLDYPLEVDGESVPITALSVGNPQCVVFVSTLPGRDEFERLGPALETHSAFPERTNVSFVQVENRHYLKVRIWERGVGPTHSSGTGCSGAAVAAIRTARAESPIEVDTGTGSQQVEWREGGEILLTGNSEFVAEVEFNWSHT